MPSAIAAFHRGFDRLRHVVVRLADGEVDRVVQLRRQVEHLAGCRWRRCRGRAVGNWKEAVIGAGSGGVLAGGGYRAVTVPEPPRPADARRRPPRTRPPGRFSDDDVLIPIPPDHGDAPDPEPRAGGARANLYDHPKYYDLVFGSDWKAGVRLPLAPSTAFEKYGGRPDAVKTLFEPACGTGRLLLKLAKAGLRRSPGNDLNPKRPWRSAITPVSNGTGCRKAPSSATWRIFPSNDAGRRLLQHDQFVPPPRQRGGGAGPPPSASPTPCGRRAVFIGAAPHPGGRRLGGGGDLARPPRSAEHYLRPAHHPLRPGRADGNAGDDVRRFHPGTRRSSCGTRCVIAPTPGTEIGRELLDRVGQFETVETYDFCYEIDEPIVIDELTEDVVYVLRKEIAVTDVRGWSEPRRAGLTHRRGVCILVRRRVVCDSFPPCEDARR